MHEALSHRLPVSPEGRGRGYAVLLVSAVSMMLAGLVSLFLVLFGLESAPIDIERPYLIPWVIATGIAILIPCLLLKSRNEFTFSNPIVFPVFTYFLPMFFLGGWSLTFGLSNYYFISYIADPEYYLPLTFVYVILGFLGLSAGYFIPQARAIGNYLSTKLPRWEFTPTEIVVACVFCLLLGFCFNIIGVEIGQVGFQTSDAYSRATGSATAYMAMLLPISSFLLWVAFFKFETWSFVHVLIVSIQIITAFFMLVIQGGKSSLLFLVVLAMGAFVLVKKKIETKHWGFFAGALAVTLVAGTLYGTKFRELKGTNDRVSFLEYSSIAFESIDQVSKADPVRELSASKELLAERLEIISAFAVVVSNHEALSSYEAAYGLENNIWTYTWTAFIPRILWKDKPIVSDSFSYNELYFDHGQYGLTITAMGDLLRNFGPIGVPIGMIVMGFALRVLYSTLVEGVPFSIWKATVYFIALTRVNYDGFYGEILPAVIRVSAVVVFQFLIFQVIVKFLRSVRG